MRLITHLWLLFGIEIRRLDGGRFGMVNVDGVIVIASLDWRVITYWTDHSKQRPETGDPGQQPIAVLLHLKRLPFHDRTHGTLDARLFAYNTMNLARVAHPDWHVTDLGEWWHRETGTPFVFALWIVSRESLAARGEAVRAFGRALLSAKPEAKLKAMVEIAQNLGRAVALEGSAATACSSSRAASS